MTPFLQDGRLEQAKSYEEYVEAWSRELETPIAGLSRERRKLVYYARYNFERSSRVQAAYSPSAALEDAMSGIEAPQTWMVLTENWCGDSAFVLPVIARAATLNPLVTLRILERDANPDVMDLYLTNGARSIPKLVAFEEEGAEVFQWGPRPAGAVQLREELKAAGADPHQIQARLIEWYESGGFGAVDGELAEAVVLMRDQV